MASSQPKVRKAKGYKVPTKKMAAKGGRKSRRRGSSQPKLRRSS